MRTEILQPLRHAPARPQRDAGRRTSWRCGPADEVEPHVYGAARPAGPATKRVLVVDDEKSIRMLCRVNLTASGIDVLEAENGLDAVELVRREKPDLVLLDVMMPDLDGFEVARRLAADPSLTRCHSRAQLNAFTPTPSCMTICRRWTMMIIAAAN